MIKYILLLAMGLVAGWVGGKSRSDILPALTIIIGHALNMLFFLRLELSALSGADHRGRPGTPPG